MSMLTGSGQRVHALIAQVKTNQQDQRAGEVRRFARELAETAPAPGNVLDAQGRQRPGKDHGQGQADTEAQDQRRAKRDFLQLQAQKQYGDRSRAGDQTAGQSEHDDLPGRHFAVGETVADVIGVCKFVRVLVAGCRYVQTLSLIHI